jgi:hypothetical protein
VTGGQTTGVVAGWVAEKVDTFKRIWGTVRGHLQPHQVGFDWQDFEWTSAGAALGDALTDCDEDSGKKLMQGFATASLRLDKLYQPVILTQADTDGFLEFDPFVSPGAETKVDRIDAAIELMRGKLGVK